ncbi:MAG: HRDC domain-containing protein [Planctomycetota bacterium]
MTKQSNPEMVTDASSLSDLCARLRETGRFAFDTEFVGEDGYKPEICLVQVATDSLCALIDPLAGGLDLACFWELVTDENIQVIVHAGSEDLALCWQQTGKAPAHVFDLQVAAGLIGLGYPTSLMRLARLTLKTRIHKSQTLTDWRKRPLTTEQIRYAVEDVAHLLRMFEFIVERLKAKGREGWAVQECRAMCDPAIFAPTGRQKLRRLRGAGSLRPQELAIAEALLDERDKLARAYNRPTRAVLRDHLLVEMARRGWTDTQQLRSLRGVSLKESALKELAAAISTAKALPADEWPRLAPEDDTQQEQALLAFFTAVLRSHCHSNDLAYALLASKQNLRDFVRRYTRSEKLDQVQALSEGWRREAVGGLLEDLMAGRSAIRVRCLDGRVQLEVE